jgi:ubiquitin-protein ligase E3 C
MRRASEAFLRGFERVVPRGWICMFSPSELQLVLGGSDAAIDVDDWRAHAAYGHGYHDDATGTTPVVGWFWEVLREFEPRLRAATLKFTTSCARPPLLGFRWLQPPFSIARSTAEEGRLPTAATCMNLLKLPAYESREMLREKLTYAVEAGSGFELS